MLGTDYPFAPAPLVPIEFLDLNGARNVLPNFSGDDLVRVYSEWIPAFSSAECSAFRVHAVLKIPAPALTRCSIERITGTQMFRH